MVVEEILPRISQELIPGTFWIKLKNSKWARSKPVLSPVVLHVRPLVWLCLPYFWLRGWYLFSFEEMLWQIKKPCIHFRIFHQRCFTPSLAGSLGRQSDFNNLRWKCVNAVLLWSCSNPFSTWVLQGETVSVVKLIKTWSGQVWNVCFDCNANY